MPASSLVGRAEFGRPGKSTRSATQTKYASSSLFSLFRVPAAGQHATAFDRDFPADRFGRKLGTQKRKCTGVAPFYRLAKARHRGRHSSTANTPAAKPTKAPSPSQSNRCFCLSTGRCRSRANRGGLLLHFFRCPSNKMLDVRGVGVAAVVLSPGKLPFQQSLIDVGQLHREIVVRRAEVFRAEQSEYRPGGNGGHEAPPLVEPLRVALFRNAVADESQPRRTQRNQLV